MMSRQINLKNDLDVVCRFRHECLKGGGVTKGSLKLQCLEGPILTEMKDKIIENISLVQGI